MRLGGRRWNGVSRKEAPKGDLIANLDFCNVQKCYEIQLAPQLRYIFINTEMLKIKYLFL